MRVKIIIIDKGKKTVENTDMEHIPLVGDQIYYEPVINNNYNTQFGFVLVVKDKVYTMDEKGQYIILITNPDYNSWLSKS